MEEIKYVSRKDEYSCYIELDTFIEYVENFKKKHPAGIDFRVESHSWIDSDETSYSEIILSCESPQTEEERQYELKDLKRREEQNKEYRRKEYLKLKKEFEGDIK